jgi:hypothetical protein
MDTWCHRVSCDTLQPIQRSTALANPPSFSKLKCVLISLVNTSAVAQIFGHGWGIDDLPRIHDVERIERLLDVLERAIELRRTIFYSNGYALAIAVLAAHGAAELQHQVADLLGDGGHELDFVLLFEVDQRPNVHTATDMAIVAGAGAMIVDDLFEATEKFWELRGSTAVSSTKAIGLRSPSTRISSRARLAYPPHAGLLWRRIGAHIGIAQAFGL